MYDTLEHMDWQGVFFRVGLSMGFSNLGFLGAIPLFERFLRGGAPTPLAVPYAFRTCPWKCTGANGDKRELAKIAYFGRYSRVFLGVLTYGEVEEIKHGENNNFLIDFIACTTHNGGITVKASVLRA